VEVLVILLMVVICMRKENSEPDSLALETWDFYETGALYLALALQIRLVLVVVS